MNADLAAITIIAVVLVPSVVIAVVVTIPIAVMVVIRVVMVIPRAIISVVSPTSRYPHRASVISRRPHITRTRAWRYVTRVICRCRRTDPDRDSYLRMRSGSGNKSSRSKYESTEYAFHWKASLRPGIFWNASEFCFHSCEQQVCRNVAVNFRYAITREMRKDIHPFPRFL